MKHTITFLLLLQFFVNSQSYAQWYPQNSGITDNLYDVQFVNENTGWILDNLHKKIFKTTNGGFDWFLQSTNPPNSLIFAFFFLNENVGWFTARHAPSGSIYKTTKGGDSWQQIYIWQCTDLDFVNFVNESKGWTIGNVCLEGGKLFQTTDSGYSWSNVVVSQSYNGLLYNIAVINELNIIVTGDGVIFKTSDGGNSWIELPVLGSAPIGGVQFMDLNVGWVKVFTYPAHQLYKTTDGGLYWMLQVQSVNSFWFSSIDNGWYVLNNNIYHTTNGGNNWALQNSNTNNSLYDIFFLDNNNGWAVGSNGAILYTPNGGLPVELVSFTAEVDEDAVILNWKTATELNNKGFEIERKAGSKQSTVGNGWVKIGYVAGFGSTTETKTYSFTDDNVASGKYSYRLKQIDFDGTYKYSEIVEVEVEIPNKFVLQQNYPNPFNPSTKIKFTILESPLLGGDGRGGLVTLKVYDVLGNEVATLVNEEKPAGSYEVGFDATGLPSGVYFYKLQAGKYIGIKKMVLLR